MGSLQGASQVGSTVDLLATVVTNGLFSVSLVGNQKSEVYYDNILVTDNKAAAPSAQK